jgi:four helix bundle protein
MGTIKRFEDLEIWQNARDLAISIYHATEPDSFKGDYSLRDQLRRASVSIMANIAEGFDRNSRKEFINFLAYSVSSASEVKSHLYLVQALNFINPELSRNLIDNSTSLAQRITKLIKYLRSNLAKRKSTK